MGFLDKLLKLITGVDPNEPIPPYQFGESYSSVTPKSTPKSESRDNRHPDWEKWKRINPERYNELLSGTRLAEQEFGFPRDINMDLSGIETSGGQFLNQLSGGPGMGYHQWEPSTLAEVSWSGFDPNSATDSARLVAKLATENRGLSRWGKRNGIWVS